MIPNYGSHFFIKLVAKMICDTPTVKVSHIEKGNDTYNLKTVFFSRKSLRNEIRLASYINLIFIHDMWNKPSCYIHLLQQP